MTEETRKRPPRAIGSETLASALEFCQRPLVLSLEQPPAPGSHWIARGWAGAARVGGRGVAAVPKATTTGGLALRLLLTILLWALLVAIAVEVIVCWALFVLPVQYLLNRSRRATKVSSRDAGDHSAAARQPSSPLPPPPPPTSGAVVAQATLDSLPAPVRESALSSCAMCGGSTKGAEGECLYCGMPVPMISARGWHRDPITPGMRRWHDGATWTSFVESAPELLSQAYQR